MVVCVYHPIVQLELGGWSGGWRLGGGFSLTLRKKWEDMKWGVGTLRAGEGPCPLLWEASSL